MISDLELRRIIEVSFLPKRCQCIKAEDNSLTVKVYDDRDPERVSLLATGIRADKLDSSRAICNLIAGLREELKQQHVQSQAPLPQRKVGARSYY